MLLLLQKGTDNLQMLRKEARSYGVESDRMSKSGQEFQDNLTNIKAAITGALIPLRQMVLDIANNLLPKISEWIKANRKLIASKFSDFIKLSIKGVKSLIKGVKTFMPLIKGMVAGFVAFKTIKIATTIFSAVKAVWALVPAITAATGGISLIIPLIAAVAGGLAVWFKESELGGETFAFAMEKIKGAISRLSEKFIGFLNKFGVSVSDVGELWEKHLAPALEWLVAGFVVTAVEAIVTAIDLVGLAFEGWGLIIDGIVSSVETLVGWFEKLANSKGIKAIQGFAGKFSMRGEGEDRGFFGNIADFYGIGNKQAPLPTGATTNNNSNSSNVTVSPTIEINSASGDPAAIGQAVNNAIQNAARNIIENQTVVALS
jgi:hypothetical protein